MTQIPDTDYAAPVYGGGEADPYLKVQYKRQQFATEFRSNVKSANWSFAGKQHALEPGAGIFVDLMDHNRALSETLIGSALVPIENTEVGQYETIVRFRDDMAGPTNTVNQPKLKIRYRIVQQ